jgi:hypothetical protein
MNRFAQTLGQMQFSFQAQRTGQLQRSAQVQRLGVKNLLSQRFLTRFRQTGDVGFKGGIPGIPEVPSFKMAGKPADLGFGKGFSMKAFKFGGADTGMKKAFLSDLLSVTKSQLIFGKATHPKLSPTEWKEASRSFFVNVPTVELKGRGRKLIKGLI